MNIVLSGFLWQALTGPRCLPPSRPNLDMISTGFLALALTVQTEPSSVPIKNLVGPALISKAITVPPHTVSDTPSWEGSVKTQC